MRNRRLGHIVLSMGSCGVGPRAAEHGAGQRGLISRTGNIAGDTITVYIGLVHVLAPCMVLSIGAVLATGRSFPAEYEERASVLEAGRRHFTPPLVPSSKRKYG